MENQDDFTTYFTPKTGTAGFLEVRPFLVKSIKSERRVISALASSGAIDRDGEIIEPSALKKAMPGFMRNPVILPSHTHRLQDGRAPVIGKVIDYRFDRKGLWIDVEFAPTALGEEYFQLYKNKFMRGFSIGFLPSKTEPRTIDGRSVRVHTELRELLEISACAIPCNPEALSKGKSFVQQKRIEREKQRIMNDDETFCKLLDRFDVVESEHGTIPDNSDLWKHFSAAEKVIYRELVQAGLEFAEGLDNPDCCGGLDFDADEIGGGPDDDVENYAKTILGDPVASDGDFDFSGDEPDYTGYF